MSAQRNANAAPAQWNYWAALLGAALVATLVPWYLGVLDIDVRPTLRALLTGGALALALMQLDLAGRGELAAAVPHFLGVIVLGAAWYLLGTFNVTGFLILFALPTYAVALECGRWTVAGVAALTIAVAVAAAVIASPELRWQLAQFDTLAALLPASLDAAPDALRFASLTAGREQLATLAVFAVTIVAVGGVGSFAATVIYTQTRALQRTDRAHRENVSLVSKLLEDSAAMEAIAFPSGRVHSVNRAFRETLGDAADGATVVAALQPFYPEPLAQLVASAGGGQLGAQACAPRGQRCMLDVAVEPLVLGGAPMRRVRLRKTAANDLAAEALDALGVAILVLGPDKTVAFANEAFVAHFPRAAVGAAAAAALDECYGLPTRWWDIAPSGVAHVRFEHDDHRCVAKIVLAQTPAERSPTSIELRVENAS